MISRAQQEVSGRRKQDVRSDALEKVLHQLDKTFKRVIARVGEKLTSHGEGLELAQGHLEILYSLSQTRPDPLRLRKNAIDFILQALKDRLMSLIDSHTGAPREFAAEEEEGGGRGEREVHAVLFPESNFEAVFSGDPLRELDFEDEGLRDVKGLEASLV